MTGYTRASLAENAGRIDHVDFQMRLLEKVEETTLHLLSLHEKAASLRARLARFT